MRITLNDDTHQAVVSALKSVLEKTKLDLFESVDEEEMKKLRLRKHQLSDVLAWCSAYKISFLENN